MNRFKVKFLVFALLLLCIFLDSTLAGVEIKLSTNKKVVCSQQILKCKITVINKTSDTICFDKHKLWNTYNFFSVYHPEEDMQYKAQIIFVRGDTFDTEPDYIMLKPGKKYSECRTLDMKRLPKILYTYYKYTVVVGPMYRITDTSEKKELDNIEVKGVEIKIIRCD